MQGANQPHENQSIEISVVIPVYRGADTITELVERLEPVLAAQSGRHEVILVNDGSPDDSWRVIELLAARFSWVVGINLMRNYGQHNATLCGVRAAHFGIILTMDDDLQHPPEQIPFLLETMKEGYDVVYGIPRKLPHNWWRNAFSWLIKNTLAYVMGIGNIRNMSAFRAFRSHLRQAFADYNSPELILDVLLSWGTTRFGTVLVDESPRTQGESNYNFLKLVRITLVVLTAFSTSPLRLASFIGFAFTFFGIGMFFYALWIYFLVGSVPGFPFLTSIISIFSGAQLFTLGIIGEYLARIFDRTMNRPCYSVRDTTQEPTP